MAEGNPIIDIDRFHQLLGRLDSHMDELHGDPRLAPELLADLEVSVHALECFVQMLVCITMTRQDDPDMPEPSRSSHHSG